MLDGFPKGRKAASIIAIGVAVYYAMALLQAFGWQDRERFLTQLIVAPFAVALWAGLAFVAGGFIDILGHRAQGSGSTKIAPHPIDVSGGSSVAEHGQGDPYYQAGHEVLTGTVIPHLWARALAKADLGELAVKAEYVRLRLAQLAEIDDQMIRESATLELTDEIPNEVKSDLTDETSDLSFNFSEAELAVYGFHQHDILEEVLRKGNEDQLYSVRNAIGRKIGRVAGIDDERAFLEAYCRQLGARLNDPLAQTKPIVGSAREVDDRTRGWPKWIWSIGGVSLILAYCNYSGRDERAEPTSATADMSYSQTSAYRDCMEASRGYNLSDYAKSDICRKSALGHGSGSDCHTEWDGRANPTICE